MANALNRFGSYCRDLRTAREKTMGDQAESFGCPIYVISAIETGRAPVPENYVQDFRNWLQLSDHEYHDLVRRARMNVISLERVKSKGTNSKSMRLFRKISKMNPAQIRNIKKPTREAKDDG